jgi:hypothetical protein
LKSWADDAIEEVEAKPERSTDKPEKSNNRQSGTEPPAQYADTVSAKSKHNTLTKTQAKRQRRRRKDRESQLMDESIWSAPPSSQSQTEAKAPKPDPKAEVQDNTERVPSEVSGEKSGFEKKSGDEENAGVEDKSGNEEINLHKSLEESRQASKNHADITKEHKMRLLRVTLCRVQHMRPSIFLGFPRILKAQSKPMEIPRFKRKTSNRKSPPNFENSITGFRIKRNSRASCG